MMTCRAGLLAVCCLLIVGKLRNMTWHSLSVYLSSRYIAEMWSPNNCEVYQFYIVDWNSLPSACFINCLSRFQGYRFVLRWASHNYELSPNFLAPLTEGQNFRSRFVPRPRPRPAPGRRPVNVNPNRIPVPSGTVFQGRPFRPFPGQPTTTTTTTTTTPTTTTSATTTTTSLPRPPPALANDAPVPNPQDTGKKADIVPRKLLNIGTGTGNRPTTQVC